MRTRRRLVGGRWGDDRPRSLNVNIGNDPRAADNGVGISGQATLVVLPIQQVHFLAQFVQDRQVRLYR